MLSFGLTLTHGYMCNTACPRKQLGSPRACVEKKLLFNFMIG